MIAYGQWETYVDAETSRQHVKELMAAGMTRGRISVLSGVTLTTLAKLLTGTPSNGGKPARRVLARTEKALLAVRANLDDLPDTALVDAAGTRRRVQSLAALGYTLKEQAEAIGRFPTNYQRIASQPFVSARVARAVRDLYDAWSMTPPPQTWTSERTRRHAAKRGWLPPLAWDDDLIDLTDEALAAALRERVEQMSDRDLVRAHTARYRDGDTTPLTLEASREYKRRVKARQRLGEAS
ncbi:hypothetical protein E1286_04980 [Nonomuraea terrae]|uniref:Uncharacterized protein n=1 Tax=Nonomuraea terrae TaxID=2530383 RepID=A0A4V2YNJ2_9ACTN|nr:hypothetical protein [Nonomuraea terrae]TDD54547.1 hypothetical protein E1286_04980 [Nonomuraea terrae]